MQLISSNISSPSPLRATDAWRRWLLRRRLLSLSFRQSITLLSFTMFFCSVIFTGHICFSRINIQFNFLCTINQVFKNWRKCVSGFEVILNHSQVLSQAQLLRLILANSKQSQSVSYGRQIAFLPYCFNRYF